MRLLLALLACTGAPALDSADSGAPPEDTGPADADGDGVYTPEDCDDTRAEVFPGAAEDPPGDGIDGDCEGGDGPAFVGCAPIRVPDEYPPIEEALADGIFSICLGPGTFTTAAIPADSEAPTALRGQGRNLTFVEDPSAHYEVKVLAGLTATGVVSAAGTLSFSDVSFVDATIDGFDSIIAERSAFVRSPIVVDVVERIAGIALLDSWIDGAEAGIVLNMDGCERGCSGLYTDLRMYGMTFTNNAAAIALDIAGDYDIYSVIENSVFYDNGAILTVKTPGGAAEVPRVSISGSGNVEWSERGTSFPDDYGFSTKEQDPLFDLAFSPPRPSADSPLIDAARGDATPLDFWGTTREEADKGAVER